MSPRIIDLFQTSSCGNDCTGAGKTTLVNHILSANHGKKIAVIENEFGEVRACVRCGSPGYGHGGHCFGRHVNFSKLSIAVIEIHIYLENFIL